MRLYVKNGNSALFKMLNRIRTQSTSFLKDYSVSLLYIISLVFFSVGPRGLRYSFMKCHDLPLILSLNLYKHF